MYSRYWPWWTQTVNAVVATVEANSAGHVSKGSAGVLYYTNVVQAGWKQSTFSCVCLVSAGDDTNVKAVMAAVRRSMASNVSAGAAGPRHNVEMEWAGWKQIISHHVQLVAARVDKNVKTVTAVVWSSMEKHVSEGVAGTRHNADVVQAGW